MNAALAPSPFPRPPPAGLAAAVAAPLRPYSRRLHSARRAVSGACPGQLAFTLVEVTVLLAVVAVLSLATYVTLRGILIRSRLGGSAQQIALLGHGARFESIKLGMPAVISFDSTGRLEAFVDRNTASGAAGSDLVYNPEVATEPLRDRLVARLDLPEGIFFGAPASDKKGGQAFVGLTPGAAKDDPPVLRLSPLGEVTSPGAVRLGDGSGNYLEVRFCGPLLHIEIRKYVDSERDWFLREERPWQWSTQTRVP